MTQSVPAEDPQDVPSAAQSIPTAESQPLLDLYPEAADHLGIGRTVAYRMAREGTFPIEVLEVGGRLKVRTADLRRYVGLDVITTH